MMKNRKKRLLLAATACVALFVFFPARHLQGEEKNSLDQKKIDAAVKKGVEWLKGQQNADGSWIPPVPDVEKLRPVGTTSMVLFALLKAGLDRKDPAARKGMNFIRGNIDKMTV